MTELKRVSEGLPGLPITLETGKYAKQANGSVILRCGDCVLLATAVMSKKDNKTADFFPLTVEFVEKMYAAGKIPGGFFKREARPSTEATLLSRLIDRPIRPSFPGDFKRDVQIVITLLSYDPSVSYDYLSITAASAALSVSDIPFLGPVAGALVVYKNGEYIVSPSVSEQQDADFRLIVAGTKDAILMIESEGKEVSEEVVIKCLSLGHDYIKQAVALQNQMSEDLSVSKSSYDVLVPETSLVEDIRDFVGSQIEDNLRNGDKKATEIFLAQLQESVIERFVVEDDAEQRYMVQSTFADIKKEKIRLSILNDKLRPDGRAFDEIRPISIETGVLPSTHGSSLFTRGETQSLGVLTLGTSKDEQMLDGVNDEENSRYFFHYNFPPYSVGETGFLRTGRRELGHGALAEKALRYVLPSTDDFDYTIRLVSEILESNGSSSMASVCSGSLALIQGGVPITSPVAGIAMGLLLDGDNFSILSDIQGLEDHYGDMDFKVAGTVKGITALQLDIKVAGLSHEILSQSLAQARKGVNHILTKMNDVINSPSMVVSNNAPKIETVFIPVNKIGMVIGQGGKTIKSIEATSQATVVISDNDDGKVSISSNDQACIDKAKTMVLNIVKDVEVGQTYDGKVVKTTTFGAFIELLPGKEGLLHISKLSKERVKNVEDVVKVGDSIAVEVHAIDAQKRINLVRSNVNS